MRINLEDCEEVTIGDDDTGIEHKRSLRGANLDEQQDDEDEDND